MLEAITLKRSLILAIFLYVLSLLWNLPAATVWKSLADRLPVPVTLHGLTGTLWSGQVGRIEVDGIDQGALSWDWRPAGLLKGAISLDLDWRPRNGQVNAELHAGLRRVTLREVNGRLDAASMAAVNKAPFVLAGSWLLDVPLLELNNLEHVGQASGRLVWDSAAGGLPQPIPLGHLSAELQGVDGWLNFTLSDQGGPLGLQGTARWRPGQPMELNTRLQARSTADAVLVGGLGLLGTPGPDGWIEWQAWLQ